MNIAFPPVLSLPFSVPISPHFLQWKTSPFESEKNRMPNKIQANNFFKKECLVASFPYVTEIPWLDQ